MTVSAARIALSLLAATVAGATMSPAQAEPPQKSMKLIFEENFDTIDLGYDSGGSHRWHFLNSRGMRVSRDQLTLEDGIARLVTPPDASWGANTSISTLPEWPESGTAATPLFKYGYYEARIKFDINPNHWPAFWLLAEKGLLHATNRLPKSQEDRWCEIDIMEGVSPTSYGGTVHDWQSGSSPHNLVNRNAHIRLPFGGTMSGWNDYGLLWTPEKITWYFNGKEMISADTPEACKDAELSLVIGAQKHKGKEDQTTWVDWIRVYQ